MGRRRRTNATLMSVAAAAGVSRQTVSNVLNAPDRVAIDTRARVESAIESLHYRPNRAARSLRTQVSRLIGYCIMPATPGMLNPVLDRFAHAITEAASDRGFHILLFTTAGGRAGLDRYAELLSQLTVDGFILSDTVVGDPRQGWLTERGVPFVAFGRAWRNEEQGAWVDVDGAAGVTLAVEHVYGLGHRRIAFIGWPGGSGVGDDRLAGYESSCARLGVTPLVVRDVGGIEQGRVLAHRVLDAPDPPTALVCVSDADALGALRAVTERGLRPGHDVAVVGFDDISSAGMPGFDLTSVSQPIEEAGRAVVNMLLSRLNAIERGTSSSESGADVDAVAHLLLKPTLVIRSSSDPTTAMETPR
ncbi:MAG: LacI family DNA-binding transcriptional regulator [Chloroflexota bacterium]